MECKYCSDRGNILYPYIFLLLHDEYFLALKFLSEKPKLNLFLIDLIPITLLS